MAHKHKHHKHHGHHGHRHHAVKEGCALRVEVDDVKGCMATEDFPDDVISEAIALEAYTYFSTPI